MSALQVVHHIANRVRFHDSFIPKDCDAQKLEEELLKLEGVLSARVNPRAKSIVLSYENTGIETLKRKIEKIDVHAYKKPQTFESSCDVGLEEKPSIAGVIRASSAMSIEPFISDDRAKFALTSVATAPLLVEGTKELFKEGLTSKVLEATAVGVSLARKDYLAANITNTMLELGEYIEETTVHRSDTLIKELAKPNIEETWIEVEVNGKKVEKLVKTSTLSVGDIVIVGAGDTISVDGHIIYGDASVNQVSMTGEAEPVKKSRGDRVISGTVVEEGRIKIWAEQVGEDTATARIKEYIKSSLSEKSAIGLKATKLADSLVPVTLGLAGFAYLINRDFESVASVLQADYSCALKLATPVAFKSSISQAGKNGVMIKGAKALEALSHVDTFVFDKTGTLTHGELEVVSINSFDEEWSEEDILNLSASAEEHYFHPVAQAVMRAAKDRGFVHMHHDEVEFIIAHGVKTVVNGKEVVIGSRHFLEDDEKISFTKYTKQIDACLKEGKAILYVGYDGKLLGTIGMVDKLRENAKTMIQRLKSLGVKEVVMLTGDIELKANVLASELGIDRVYANMLPTSKAGVIKELQKEGKKVAFVGDGINDAPALMSANVGISMQKGADIAKATADIGLLKDDIEAVCDVKELANKTMKRIKSNFYATVGINSGILLGATMGVFSPIATAVLHNGTTIGLLLNSVKRVNLEGAKG
ncbi:MAG TPA: heavy metal translocating P-type ATPase [Sulfurospirillum sp. UBA12182]|nr:MAG TPA: heavy metal translocating P-type ATPase [Sulfurospirillum sp. UBA12182]